MPDASYARKKLLRKVMDALTRADRGDPMSIPVRTLVRDAFEASGWDRKHREEVIGKMLIGSLFFTAWDLQRGLGDVGNLRMLLHNNALDAMQCDTAEQLQHVERRVDPLIEQIKQFWNAPG